MRKVSWIKLLFLSLAFFATSCFFEDNDNSTGTTPFNVEGTWHAQVIVQACTPSNVCDAAGFTSGGTVNATMTLRQNGTNVEGTFTYEGSGINSDVSGDIEGDQLFLNGSVTNPLGRATVRFVGTISGATIRAVISHDVNLIDGRSGTISGSGDFSR